MSVLGHIRHVNQVTGCESASLSTQVSSAILLITYLLRQITVDLPVVCCAGRSELMLEVKTSDTKRDEGVVQSYVLSTVPLMRASLIDIIIIYIQTSYVLFLFTYLRSLAYPPA